MTPQETQILRRYAAGADPAVIATDLGVPHGDVTAIVTTVGFDRGRARERLHQREATVNQREATLNIEPRPDTIEQRLLRAEAIPRLRARAIRIRGMLDALGRDLESQAVVAHAEQDVARLRAELATAVGKLRRLTKPAAAAKKPTLATPPAADEVDRAAVRAWAAEHGIQCSPSGRIKRTVVEQYLAAQKSGQVAA